MILGIVIYHMILGFKVQWHPFPVTCVKSRFPVSSGKIFYYNPVCYLHNCSKFGVNGLVPAGYSVSSLQTAELLNIKDTRKPFISFDH